MEGQQEGFDWLNHPHKENTTRKMKKKRKTALLRWEQVEQYYLSNNSLLTPIYG